MIAAFLRARHPLALPPGPLPPPLLLMARLVILALMVRGYGFGAMPSRRVPFFAWCETIGSGHDWKLALVTLFFTGAALVFFNFFPRLGCLLVGSALVTGTLIDSAGFANSRLFPGCLLVLTALQDGGTPARLALRAQIVLLYVGATLSKLFEPDWWSGQYFEFWLREKLAISWYSRAADALPPMALSSAMGITCIVMESVICVALLRRSTWPLAFATAVIFHVSAFLVCGLDFGVFLYVSLLSFLVFAPDDFFHRLAALRIPAVWRTLVSTPAVWTGCILTILLAGKYWPPALPAVVAAFVPFSLWIVIAYNRPSGTRPGKADLAKDHTPLSFRPHP